MFAVIKKWRTPQELAECFVHQGKPHRQMRGTWITDLASLGKTIWLCPLCVSKFRPKAYNYENKKDLPTVRGTCDACREHGLNTLFVHRNHRDGWNGNV